MKAMAGLWRRYEVSNKHFGVGNCESRLDKDTRAAGLMGVIEGLNSFYKAITLILVVMSLQSLKCLTKIYKGWQSDALCFMARLIKGRPSKHN